MRHNCATQSRSIAEVVEVDREAAPEDRPELKETLETIDKVAKLYALAAKQAARFLGLRPSKKIAYLRARRTLVRTRVELWPARTLYRIYVPGAKAAGEIAARGNREFALARGVMRSASRVRPGRASASRTRISASPS